jgi:hypothetical protein
VDARKTRYGKADLKKLFKDANKVVTARGKKSVEFDLRQGFPPLDELAKAALGPSGNLRAPAARMGKSWLVGFGEEAWSGTFD